MDLAKILFFSAASAATASSQTVIDIAGSPSGRSAVHSQILAVLSNETLAWNDGPNAADATRVIYKGTFNGTPVIVRTYWGGIAEGIHHVALATRLDNRYLDASTNTAQGASPAGIQITSPFLAPASAETVTEIGFAEVSRLSSSLYQYDSLTREEIVGVVPYKIFKNHGASQEITNITSQALRYFYGSAGSLPRSFFNDMASDEAMVFATGTDRQQGIRTVLYSEINTSLSAVSQYTGTVSGGVATLSSGTTSGGFSRSVDVAHLLAGTYAGGDILGYVAGQDWPIAVAGGAQELAFNGIYLGTAPGWEEKIQQGQYTFWSYLHQNSMTLTGASESFYNALKHHLKYAPDSGLIPEPTMAVERSLTGSPPMPKDDFTLDADADGLSDLWEMYYFGGTGIALGSVVSQADGLTNDEKDDLGLSPLIDYSGPAVPGRTTYIYDLAGRLNEVTAPIGPVTYGVDEEGNIESAD